MKEPELITYWIVIYVSLPKALPIQDAEGSGIPSSAVGYYQRFGVTQPSVGAARQLVAGQIFPLGSLDWGESMVYTVDVERLDPSIVARSGDWSRPGIWYKSGRIFVSPSA